MLRRLLLLGLALLALFWWLKRLLGRGRPPQTKGRGSAAPALEGEMVRDRVCNTFLPRSKALSLQVGSQQEFFCSERCRDAFVSRNRARA